ncbi:MAG: hypothetical protein M3R17_00410 [Bacteroidota bacterium]|nr:hypothetical protein [Bacteroidota bacterium]
MTLIKSTSAFNLVSSCFFVIGGTGGTWPVNPGISAYTFAESQAPGKGHFTSILAIN